MLGTLFAGGKLPVATGLPTLKRDQSRMEM